MTVFMVTSGCYSDYTVEGIFSTKEKAQEYIDRKATDSYKCNGIDEIEIDNVYNFSIRDERRCFYGNIEEDGTLAFGINSYDGTDPFDKNLFDNYYQIMRDNSMDFTIKTFSKEHAIKIVNDKRAELIACDQWYPGNKIYF